MNCYIVGIKHGQRQAVFAVLAESEAEARSKVLGRNTGWAVEFVKHKTDSTVFRIFDDAWYEAEHGEVTPAPEAQRSIPIDDNMIANAKLATERGMSRVTLSVPVEWILPLGMNNG